MRGSDRRSGSLFSYVDLEARVRADHPLRTIRVVSGQIILTLGRPASRRELSRASNSAEVHDGSFPEPASVRRLPGRILLSSAREPR